MPNFDKDSATTLAARYYLRCPLCRQAEGAVMLDQNGGQIHVTCKQCGQLGVLKDYYDWACPAGISALEQGKSVAVVLQVMLADNPPDAVTQLGAIARRTTALQSGDGNCCPTCGHRTSDAGADPALA
jgi:transcription elongation factor Elf1